MNIDKIRWSNSDNIIKIPKRFIISVTLAQACDAYKTQLHICIFSRSLWKRPVSTRNFGAIEYTTYIKSTSAQAPAQRQATPGKTPGPDLAV